MKIIKVSLFVLIILLTSSSSKEHLLFNNLPVDGHLDKFVSELTKTGFIISASTKKNEIVLKGEFLDKIARFMFWEQTKII